jgi:hypothetical protein
MPTPYRVKGVSISTATNWAMNYIVGAMTPILQERIRWRLYPMHAFFCVVSFIIVFFTFPGRCPPGWASRMTDSCLTETRGVSLEQMSQLFEDEPDEKEQSPERQPLARSRSRSRSPVRGDTESQIEPPDLKGRMDDSGGVLGYLFGSEIEVGFHCDLVWTYSHVSSAQIPQEDGARTDGRQASAKNGDYAALGSQDR